MSSAAVVIGVPEQLLGECYCCAVSFYWFANHPNSETRRYHTALEWNRKLVNELESRRVDVVLDVGANSGQFATSLRNADFKGRIISFEPLSRPFSLLERNASADPLWDCRRCALGDYDGTVEINVAANGGVSSSILPMLKRHHDVYPQGDYIRTEEVAISRLDSVAAEVLGPNDKAFLKVDVQGFERQVIAGGAGMVDDQCIGMHLELSFMPLYEGGMLIQEALELVYSRGFRLAGFVPFFFDIRNGQLLQADGVFFRRDTNPEHTLAGPSDIR